MEVSKAIKERRSIRKYTDKKISQDIIHELLNNAIMAPSAMNSQPWAFFVIQNSQMLSELNTRIKKYLLGSLAERPYLGHYKEKFESAEFDVLYGSSTLLVICSKPGSPNAEGDCHMAAQNIMLSAKEREIGSCCLGFARMYLNTDEARQWLKIPENLTIVTPMVLGYCEENPEAPNRNPVEILFWY